MLRFIMLGLVAGMLAPLVLPGQGTRLLRQPTISSQYIAFVYADDIWLVEREGGAARRLTSFEGAESYPHFSPDGQWLAFTAQYDGNSDVYVIPTAGGEPQRLTWHPGPDVVQGWTPDGQAVVFQSGREGVPTQLTRFYSVPRIGGGFPTALPAPQAAYGELSPDGRYLAYQPITFWDPEFRNYRGGQAMPIWILDLKDYRLIRTPQTDRERHMDPVWVGNKVYFLSERDYASNIWSFELGTARLEQVTRHRDFDVKSLDAAADRIVYEQGGYLHLLDPKTGQTRQLSITVAGDFNWARPRWEDIKPGQLQNASLSPTGKRALFEYRGEIFSAPREHGDVRNLTNATGSAERFPVWSPEGDKIAWFSDASGEYELVIANQEGLDAKRYPLPNPTFFFRPAWSPDGKYLAFTDTDYNLWQFTVATGALKKIDTDRFAHPNRTLQPVWSPDSRWIAYTRLLDNQFKAIFVYEVATGKSTQFTNGLADAQSPAWDESGKYLYFLASTDFGMNVGWLDMSAYDRPVTRSVYVAVLRKTDPSPLAPRSDEEEGQKEMSKKDTAKLNIKIDFDQLDQRILSLELPARDYQLLVGGPTDHVFYWEALPNNPNGGTLHRYSLKERKAVPFLEGVQAAMVSHDRKSLLYRSGETWGIVKADGPPTKVGEGRLRLDAKVKIDPPAEWKQIFREGWRYQRDFLYVDNVHGAPWNDIYRWYSPWIDHVRHRTDLNYVVDILGGEVAVGHSYTSGGDFPTVKSVPIGLLGADFELVNGFYRIKKIYTTESWNPELKAPLSGPGLDVQVGDYLLEVNGKALQTPLNLYQLFEGTAGKQVKIRVNRQPVLAGSRLLTVVPVASEAGLRQRNWVEENRRKVDALSGGKLAYVYVPNTGNPGYTSFNRYYFAQQDKQGAVIDERNNGGGSAADYIVDVLARKLRGYFNSNAADHRPFTVPNAGIWGPKVMIINERAGSGGDLMPYLFRDMKIGPLIGTRTWGGLVGTWDTPPFVDGGRMVAPRGGFYDVNGQWAVEGEGIAPDIEVLQDPAAVIKGGDPQLERAVQEALQRLPAERIELKPEPAPPIKYKRPKG